MADNTFVFSIDTEADRKRKTYQNLLSLERAQSFLEKYGIKPTYLCTYDVASHPEFYNFAYPLVRTGKAEIGSHMHPWTSPPFDNPIDNGCPWTVRAFPSEHTDDAFEQKLSLLTDAIETRYGRPTSYRAGRFGFRASHARLLAKYGYSVDSSITPYVDWSDQPGYGKQSGPDFSSFTNTPFLWTSEYGEVLELPVTIGEPVWFGKYLDYASGRIPHLKHLGDGQPRWLRPFMNRGLRMRAVAKQFCQRDGHVLVLMMHSNEFDPKTNGYFSSKSGQDYLFSSLSKLFEMLNAMNVQSAGLTDAFRYLSTTGRFSDMERRESIQTIYVT